jgi:hypothetical protein
LLADNDTNLGLSAKYPTAQSLFDLIDEIVDNEAFHEDAAGTPNAPVLGQEQSISCDPCPSGLVYLVNPLNAPRLEQGEFSIFESSLMDLSYEEPSLVEAPSGLRISHDTVSSIAYPCV